MIERVRDPRGREDRSLLVLHAIWGGRINRAFALALATEVANNPEVRAAFAAQDRDRLIERLLLAGAFVGHIDAAGLIGNRRGLP